ncbi:MAG: hypothetical protein ACREQK_01005, partial [Candidatus Binatia bacterium]
MPRLQRVPFVRTASAAIVALLGFLISQNAQAQKIERIAMAGGPPAGVFGIFATGIATYLSKSVPNLDV